MTKRLIICADGTWNTPEQEGNKGGAKTSTNVLKLLRALNAVAADGTPQIRFYCQGVGTGNVLDRFTGGSFGVGLSANVLDCYRFLANNYCPGDEIYIFGFSRGAFTARSLGGLIGALGFIHPRRLGRLPQGWSYYRIPPDQRVAPEAQALLEPLGERRTDIPIACIGVWDTVGALGIPLKLFRTFRAEDYTFHDVELGRTVKLALHALAIDEQRKVFAPTLWDESKVHPEQTVRQVWFPGVHSNIGGGYADQGLSDIALDWMIGELKAHTPLSFDDAYIAEAVDPRVDGTLYDSRGGLLWKLWPGLARAIPPGATVHPSARERRLAVLQPTYDPPNLIA